MVCQQAPSSLVQQREQLSPPSGSPEELSSYAVPMGHTGAGFACLQPYFSCFRCEVIFGCKHKFMDLMQNGHGQG